MRAEDVELHVRADGASPLLEAIRSAVREAGGRPPSRRQVVAWVREGRVRLDGTPARAPSDRPARGTWIEVTSSRSAPADTLAASSPAPCPEGPGPLLHLDAQLVVAEVPPGAELDPPSVEQWLGACLVAAGIRPSGGSLDVLPAWHPGGHGLVLAARKSSGSQRLAEAWQMGRASGEVRLITSPGGSDDLPGATVLDAGPAGLLVRTPLGPGGTPALVARLASAGREIGRLPGPGPSRARPLALQVARLTVPHPRTGRMLRWQARPGSSLDRGRSGDED